VARTSGIKIIAQFRTIAGCDGVLIVSADSETQALPWLSGLVSGVTVTTETRRAFDAAEFEAIVANGWKQL
jgi:uncharacterized protein with GYD domain